MRQLFCLIALMVAMAAQAAPGIATDAGSIHFIEGLQKKAQDLSVSARYAPVRFARSYAPDTDARWQWNQRWQPLGIQENEAGETVVSRNGDKFQGASSSPGSRLTWSGRSSGLRGGCDYVNGKWTCVWTDDQYARPGAPDILVLEDGYRWESRQGDWVEYSAQGLPRAYGQHSNTHAKLEHDEQQRIARVRNTDDALLLTIGYPDDETRNPAYVEDYSGRRVSYEYDTQGQLVGVVDVIEGTWSYEYNQDGQLIAFTDPRSNTTRYDYDLNDDVQYRITYPDGYQVDYAVGEDASDSGITVVHERHPDGAIHETRHGRNAVNTTRRLPGDSSIELPLMRSYRVNGELIDEVYATEISDDTTEQYRLERQADGFFSASQRDFQGRLVRRWFSDGSEERWSYAPNSFQVATHTNRKGVVTRYRYDAEKRVSEIIEAEGKPEQRSTKYSYPDDQTRVITRSGPGGADTVNRESLDSYGNVIAATDPEGHATTYSYNAQGRMLTRTLPGGGITTYTYDNAGNPLTIVDPIQRKVVYDYDEAGNQILEIAPNQAETHWEYDERNEISAMIDPAGNRSIMEHNREDRELVSTDPLGNKSRQVTTPLGLPAGYQDREGNEVSWQWQGNQLTQVQYPTFSQRFDYEHRQMSAVVDQWSGQERQTRFNHDPLGQIVEETDALQNSTKNEYDSLNRAILIRDAEGGVTRLAYDFRDNLLSLTDPEGRVTSFEYDRNGRVVAEIRYSEAGIENRRTYAYDGDGNLIEELTPKGERVVYGYDQASQLKSIHFYSNADQTTTTKVMTFAYTQLGHLESYDDGDTSGEYLYDDQGQLTQATTHYGPFSKTIGYTYNANGRIATYTNPEGITYSYHYTPGGEIERITIPGEGEVGFGNRKWSQPRTIQLPGGNRIDRQFDGLMRMTETRLMDGAQMDLFSVLYDYDAVNNILNQDSSRGEYQYDYDAIYRLTVADYPQAEQESFGYDGVGNRIQHTRTGIAPETLEPLYYNEANQLIQRGNTHYEYDTNGHLIRKESPSEVQEFFYDASERLIRVEDGHGGTIADYGYNSFGHRMWKDVDAGSHRTYFLYNHSGLVGEYDSNGNLIHEYHYKPDQAWMTRPLFMRAANQIYYYHNDHLGTPQKLVSRNGTVVWAARYDVFGKAKVLKETVANPLRFPGQYEDRETGFHHNYFRDYDPNLGRYVQADPIGIEGGINLYAYSHLNPVRYIDPIGQSPLCSVGQDDDCVDTCIRNRYGGIYAAALTQIPALTFSSGVAFGIGEATDYGSERARARGNRDTFRSNPRGIFADDGLHHRRGSRMLRVARALRWASGIQLAAAVGSGTFVLTAQAYCHWECR